MTSQNSAQKTAQSEHEHVFTALYWHFGPYGNQKVHVHSCFEEGCDQVLIGKDRKCDGKSASHHRDHLWPND